MIEGIVSAACKIAEFVKENASAILTIVNIGTTVAAVVMTAKETPDYSEDIHAAEEELGTMTKPQKAKIIIKHYGKVIAICGISIAAAVFAYILNKQAQAALTAAYLSLMARHNKYRELNREINGQDSDDEIMARIEDANPDRHIEFYNRDAAGETPSNVGDVQTFMLTVNGHTRIFKASMAQVAFAHMYYERTLTQNGEANLAWFIDAIGLTPSDDDYKYGFCWCDEQFDGTIPCIDIDYKRPKAPNHPADWIMTFATDPIFLEAVA